MSQINPTVGAIKANAAKIIDIIIQYQHSHDLVVFPELALSGYPPEDLLFQSDLYEQIEDALNSIQNSTENCHVIIGHPECIDNNRFNSLSIFHNKKRITTYQKQHLPNYGVFDEQRYFQKGNKTTCTINLKGFRLGFCICEDLWQKGPVEALIAENIDLLVSINASPYDIQKYPEREALLVEHAKKGFEIIYVNLTGGQDELVFDGRSLAIDRFGQIKSRAHAFKEDQQSVVFTKESLQGLVVPQPSDEALIYEALCCGLHDYVKKNGFAKVLLGLSGGIDSALTLAIACDALGAENVHAILLPSRYTSKISIDDAIEEAKALNVDTSNLSIEPTFKTLLATLPHAPEITQQNLQARIRGILLMALSNTTNSLVLSTSNKSETAVGYATLYGDMCGAFSVLKDVLKTTVYQLAAYRNTLSPVIPERVITRPPSAELTHNQTDQDSLPPYEVLDAMIIDIMENQLSLNELIHKGYDEHTIQQILTLIKRNEYKRRQSAPGVKITTRAFGRDWRYPITSGFYACKIESNR